MVNFSTTNTPAISIRTEISNSEANCFASPLFILDTAATIDRPVPFEEGFWLQYSMRHQPPEIAIMKATSIDDYNSANQLRVASYWIQRGRLWGAKLFGLPRVPRTVAQAQVPKGS